MPVSLSGAYGRHDQFIIAQFPVSPDFPKNPPRSTLGSGHSPLPWSGQATGMLHQQFKIHTTASLSQSASQAEA